MVKFSIFEQKQHLNSFVQRSKIKIFHSGQLSDSEPLIKY
jgi:hypothetical protein